MNYLDDRKGIYVFSDAAGANAVLSIVDELLNNSKKPGIDFQVFSDSQGKFDREKYGFVVQLNYNRNEIDKVLELFCPDFVFTATSFHDYEYNWRQVTKSKNIYTYGFIDHWIYYKDRFTFRSLTSYPDEVLVINEIARDEAIKEGIPESVITVFGNPYYKKIRNYHPLEIELPLSGK